MELEELAEPDWMSADLPSGTEPEPLAGDDGDTLWVDAYEL
jgi:hypothetical protein